MTPINGLESEPRLRVGCFSPDPSPGPDTGAQISMTRKGQGSGSWTLSRDAAALATGAAAVPNAALPATGLVPESAAQELLRQAQQSLERGDMEEARASAILLLGASRRAEDPLLESKALLFLANCDRLASRYRRAYDTSRRAAHLAQRANDVPGEVLALGMLAHVASSLGRNEEAIEAAMLGARLIEDLPPSETGVLCLNYLGVAYLWARCFDKADAQFDEAVRYAARCAPAANPLLPRANQLCVELLKTFLHRYTVGILPPLAEFEQRTAQFERDFEFDVGKSVVPGCYAHLFSMLVLIWGGMHCFAGRMPLAQQGLERARELLAASPAPTWGHAMAHWLDAEIARANGDWGRAEAQAEEMINLAVRVEHEQLACMGFMCASDIFAAQGKHERARHELHRLRHREQMIRAETLDSRARVVAWQLELRLSEQRLNVARSTSRQFETLALQDGLTGIANRRHLHLRLAELLLQNADGAHPLCVALVDVDRFKRVNDSFGHATGDAVLKAIAELLVAHVRDGDLPARLAGDEFVIVFDRLTLAEAALICARIQEAVRRHDWSRLAVVPGIGISVGVAQSRPGDTAESLLERSDIAMYDAKRAGSV
jgi:diguanylate cyclase (GGDEF)-like protein